MKAVERRTNGDRVEVAVGRAKQLLAEGAAWAREHPDEACVAAVPVLLAWHLSLKYEMDFADHMLVTEGGYWAGMLALRMYRQWKERPARPSGKEAAS